MITIDEIMGQANRYALRNAQYCAAHVTNHDLVSGEAAALRHIITQAIAEALAEGARETRELCAAVCDTTPPHPFRPSIEAAHAVRALPLPAKREPVRLTDEQVRDCIDSSGYAVSQARAIETAVLAANGMTK